MRALLLILLVFSSAVFAQVNQVDSKGRKQGPWEKVYKGTVVYQYRGQFKDDKPVGKFTYFYKSSKVKAVVNHGTDGRSEAFFYHENGVLMSYGIYRDMKKDSIWTNFGPSGKLSNKETYKNDILDGPKVVFFVPEDPADKSQRISAMMYYKQGELHGEYTEYFIDGTVMRKGQYESGKKVGVWDEFHPNGKKSHLYRYKNGLKHGWTFSYDENGKELFRVYYYYGRKLEGEELQEKMRQMKELGINPNE